MTITRLIDDLDRFASAYAATLDKDAGRGASEALEALLRRGVHQLASVGWSPNRRRRWAVPTLEERGALKELTSHPAITCLWSPGKRGFMRAGLTYEAYDALVGWRWSHIKLLDASPLHFRYAIDHPDDDTDTRSRRIFRAAHALVFERGTWSEHWAVYHKIRRGKEWEAFKEKHAGKSIITGTEYDDALPIADAVLAHPLASAWLSEGIGELTMCWMDPETGLPCKGRLDWFRADTREWPAGVLDLKSTTTDSGAFGRLVARNLWHGQQAHYISGLGVHGVDAQAIFIAAETKPPYDVALFECDEGLPDGALPIGEELRSSLMRQLADCLEADHWPGRQSHMTPVMLPSYAVPEPEITFATDTDDN